jgi:hypothetical protein
MFGKFCFRTFVGIVLGLAMGGLVGGRDFMQGLALAIICTAGISLIVILPACYLIGLAATIAFIPWGSTPWSYAEKEAEERRLARRAPLQGRTPVDISSLPRAERALATYAARASQLGETPATIERRLLDAGWSPQLVRQTITLLGLAKTDTPPPPPPRPDPY